MGMFRKTLFALFLLLMISLVATGANRRFTLVIDAGHGGHDFGAPGSFSQEKELTLKYALAFGRLVERNCPDVRVVYTRKTDVFIPLHERATIANNKKADLFMSFHINALDGNHTARGFQSYTLGRGERSGDKGIRENLEVAKRENSVIFLEKDYQKTYKGLDNNSAESDIMFEFIADKNRERSVELSRLLQREVCRATGRQDGGSHQNNLAVLRLTSMPATLLELGFISTPDEEQFLNSEEALNLFSKGIYNAFIKYKNKYDEYIDVPYRAGGVDVSEQPVAVDVDRQEQDSDTDVQAAKTEEKNVVAQPEPQPTSGNTGSRETSRRPSSTGTRQTAGTSKPVVAATTSQVVVSKPVFKVQIVASSRVLGANDAALKGLSGCEYYEEGGFKKYTYGASNNYNEIYRLRKQILDKFPQCFIIAFKDGKKIDVNEGIREFKSNR
jgi:N-acetylmuramoyl-L-alanine amidase